MIKNYIHSIKLIEDMVTTQI